MTNLVGNHIAKKFLSSVVLAFFLFTSSTLSIAQSSAEKFGSIIQTSEIAKFFDGLFDKLGIVV